MKNLKAQLIKIGNANPDLQKHLKPVIKVLQEKQASVLSSSSVQKQILDELVLVAENDGDSYRKNKDARGAVEKAAKGIIKEFLSDMEDLKRKAIKDVKDSWKD